MKRSRQFFVSVFFGCIAFAFLCNLAISQFLIPLDGVLVQASALYQDAGKQYVQVLKKPLPAGSEVEVMGKKEDWVKIRTQSGEVGYVFDHDIYLIS